MTDPTRPKLRSAAAAGCRTASTAPPLITQKALDGVRTARCRVGCPDADRRRRCSPRIEAQLVVGALFASGDDAEVDLRRRCRSDAEHDTRENGAPEPRAHTSFRHLPVSRWRAS